ncbi:MAG: type II toxin-antitoxin system VapC family toxin [Caulobacter sp.]|nr:type II toxin-antitoxin system VapC family toxin [Caulobacter sp.]
MTTTVLDASVIAAWLVPSQSTPASEVFLKEAAEGRFLAPYIFPAECRSLLLRAERRGGLTTKEVAVALDFVDKLAIQVMPMLDRAGHDDVLALARRETLSLYDALYLYVAIEADARLASRDGGMLMAAARRGLVALDLRA